MCLCVCACVCARARAFAKEREKEGWGREIEEGGCHREREKESSCLITVRYAGGLFGWFVLR